jgi:hypothetical protein
MTTDCYAMASPIERAEPGWARTVQSANDLGGGRLETVQPGVILPVSPTMYVSARASGRAGEQQALPAVSE